MRQLCFVNCGLPGDQCACYREHMAARLPVMNEQTGLYWDETVQGWKQFRPWDSTFTDRLRQEQAK